MDMHRRAGSRRDTDGRLCHRRQSEQRACAAGSYHTCHDNRTGGNGSIRCNVCITAVISRTAYHAGDNTEDNTGGNTGGSRFSGTACHCQAAGSDDRAQADRRLSHRVGAGGQAAAAGTAGADHYPRKAHLHVFCLLCIGAGAKGYIVRFRKRGGAGRRRDPAAAQPLL